MGFTELLTIVFIALKLLGLISWSWWLVLLPQIIATVIYLIAIIHFIILNVSTNRLYKKWFK